MKFSLNWLKEYWQNESFSKDDIENQVSLIDEKITQKSFEIEGIEEKDNDFIFDISVLPNRAHDCFCHHGIANEISAITDFDFVDKVYQSNDSTLDGEFSLEVSSDLCYRYIGCQIENIKIGPSPIELKNKLESIGERSINNIVDITNIVMFEIGQPMHAFDTDKLSGKKIFIRPAKDSEKIITLDNKELNLNQDILVIADEKDVLAMAGIKGGKKAEVNSETKNIILEAANFNSANIRKNSRKLGVTTESSHRFENQITPYLAEKGINMAIDLIKKYASDQDTKIYKNIEYYPKSVKDFYSGISVSEISKLLGRDFKEQEVEDVFKKLRFQYDIVQPEERIVELSKKLVGKKYKWGASVTFDAPDFFDCSSFVCYVFRISGITIPRISADQFVYGQEISKEEILPGDLVFSINPEVEEHGFHFESREFLKGTKIPDGVDHVGIYMGDNKIIHATNWNNSGVIEENLDNSQRFKKIVGYRRYYDRGEKRFLVKIPHERIDLINVSRKFEMKHIDLIEEVGRIFGYENIKNTPIEMKGFNPKINLEYTLNNKIRMVLVDLGFSEVITYSFVSSGELMPEKPLAEDKKYIRSDLKTGINLSLENNLKYVDLLNLDTIKVFEIGKIFKKDYTEKLVLTLAVKNKNGFKKSKAAEILKEAILKLEAVFGLNDFIKISDNNEIIEIDLGEIYQRINSQNIPDFKYQKLPELNNIKFKSISNYPFITRDIAVWIPKNEDIKELIELIKKHTGHLLANEPRCFDVFEKDGRVSYAYRMVFQSHDKTLTDSEANEIMEKIYADIKNKINWEIR